MTRFIFSAGPTSGDPRISENPPLVKSSVRDDAELRFPQAEHVRVIERVTVIEAEHSRLGEQAVVDADARLVRREMEQRHVGLAALRIVEERMARAESSAATILAREPDRN